EDMLGSSRTMVQAGQTAVCYDADFYPFGGERDITNTCTQNYKFEGKERDTETGNDDFGARYFAYLPGSPYRGPGSPFWRLGRWLSADWSAVPAPVPYANLTNPQTLNLYAMVSDNPETFADLDGHVTCGQALPGSLENCTPAAPSPAATTGEGQKTGDGIGLSMTQKTQNGVTTVTLTSSDANVTTNKDGSITMTTTTTTQTYKFNSAGNLISGQSQTVGTAFTMKDGQSTTQAINSSRTLTPAEATRTLGGTDFSHMDTRGTLARFAADTRAHPGEYVSAAGEIGLLFVPVADELEGFKLSLELHVAAVKLAIALEDR
ncbi:MAG: RHS repeat-associated core domain-containing protein, partial [Candidatus Acidiferrales bacterium]